MSAHPQISSSIRAVVSCSTKSLRLGPNKHSALVETEKEKSRNQENSYNKSSRNHDKITVEKSEKLWGYSSTVGIIPTLKHSLFGVWY